MSEENAQKTGLAELGVVNFRTETHMSQSIRDWKVDAPVMVAESCARQVWMGRADDFSSFPYPPNNVNAVKFLNGRDAYAFLLKLLTGSDSEKSGESNITGQFFNAWKEFADGQAARAASLDTVMQHIRADSALIRREVTLHIKPVRHEMAARYLSGQAKGDTALVIGHTTSTDGETANMTTALFKALGNNRKSRVSKITVMHPKKSVAVKLAATLRDLQQTGFLHPDVELCEIPFEDFSKALETHQRVYVDMPMNTDEDAELAVRIAWQDRNNRSNTLTWMRGDPRDMGRTSPFWQEPGIDNFISPDDIRAEMARLGRENNRLKAEAEALINFCATERAAGRSPQGKKQWAAYQATRTPKPSAP